ncbi:MAG TPA: hypothetical protein VF158_01275 [Longimicrobiales bacterium]
MSDPVERCAREVLDADAALTLPLSRLHRALVAEAGPSVGTYGQLRDRLRRSPDRFTLVEPPALPWDAEAWPEEARRSYRDGLRRVGVVAEPRVVLREPGSPAGGGGAGLVTLFRRADAALIELWAAVSGDPEARAPVVEAMTRVDDLRAAASQIPTASG